MRYIDIWGLCTLLLAGPAVAQPMPITNDTAAYDKQIISRLDTIHADLQALLKALQSAPVSTGPAHVGANTAPANAAPTAAPTASVEQKYFPADVGSAPFPSPENSSILRLGRAISGKPYLRDKSGSVFQMVPATPEVPNGYLVNGAFARGGGSDNTPIGQLLVRQGEVYSKTSGGVWQHFQNGGLYNASLPDAYQTDASGQTTSTVATSSVAAPARAARARIAPGSSGKVLKVCAAGCAYPSLTAAIGAAGNGDTVEIGAGTYREAPPVIAVTLKIVWERGAVLDLTGLTGRLARGKGAIVPTTDLLLVNPVITGTAMDQGSAQGTAAIRPDIGCNYIDIQGGELFKNQNGVAGGDVPVVLTMTGTYLHDNGLGDGYTHNIYMSSGTLAVVLTNVRSLNPNGGHALKTRAFNTTVTGGEFEAFSAAAIDIPQGSVSQAVLDGVTIIKRAGAYNHAVADYASENNASGNGGLLIKNSTLDLLCDNPFFNVGAASVVTIDPSTKITGTKPTVQGGKVVGL